MNIIGREIEVGVGLESVRGTPTTPSRWIKKVTASILPKVEKKVDESTFGVLEDSESARIVKKWSDGDIEGIVHADVIGYLLANLYGSVASSVVVSGVYEHEFTLEQSIEHPSLSIYRKDGDVENKKYGGGVVNSLEISAVTDDYVRFTSNILLSTSADSVETPSYAPAEYDFIGRDVSVKVADTEAGLVGATALVLKEATISLNSNAIADHKLGSFNPDVYNSGFGIEVSITKNYGDTTFEDLFNSNTYKYMEIKIEGEADLGSGNKPTLTILLNKAQVQTWERSGDANSLVEEAIGIKAFYNSVDSQASKITLQNKTATYTIGS